MHFLGIQEGGNRLVECVCGGGGVTSVFLPKTFLVILDIPIFRSFVVVKIVQILCVT